MTEPEQQQTMIRKSKAVRGGKAGFIAVMAVATVLVVGAGTASWLLMRTEHPAPEGRHVEVRIPKGAGTEQIGRMLSAYGVIKNSLMFDLKVKMAKSQLRPGTYQFATGMPDDLVIERLVAGPQEVFFEVPIPEGFTATQIARRFAARTGVSEDEMTSLVMSGAPRFVTEHPCLADAPDGSLEGYLYPATYRVKKGTKPADIVEMMLDRFDEATADLDVSYATSKNLTFSDVITIASMIERETKLSREYPLVASVIYNRLHARMRLQVDATALYVAPEGTTELTKADLRNPSPYNTYRHEGLPPGPICSPGIEAIRAAAKPAQSTYMYYVLTGKDGSQTFTTTYEDFLEAKKKNRQIFGN